MKMKIKEIISTLNNLNHLTNLQTELIASGQTKPMPINITFAISKNKKAITAEHDNYITEGLLPLNEKFALEIDANGGVIIESLTEEGKKEYLEELDKLQNMEVEVEIQKIKHENFLNYQPLLMELEILDFMIED